MSGAPQREQFELTAQDESGDDLETQVFDYEFPFIDKTTRGRTVTQEPIGRDTVVQYMGPESLEVTIEGHCYVDEANFIDELSDSGRVSVVSDRWTGDGVIKDTRTSATGEGGGVRNGESWRIYEYSLTIVEIGQELPPGGVL